MTEPWFWRSQTHAARAARGALLPAAALYGAGQSLRRRWTKPIDPGVPVICVGNACVGGTGKTPFCLLLQNALAAEGLAATFLTRGYRGSLAGPLRVEARHTAGEVGDEALLLAAAAPTWVAKDRAAGAVAAARAGARLLIMDDGFQNPTIRKTVSFLLLSGEESDLALFPAGPMRERISLAKERADAIVLPANAALDAAFDAAGRATRIFRTATEISLPFEPRPVVAFCGIARPQRFFSALERRGYVLKAQMAFPDHHAFTADDLRTLRALAGVESAALVTTQKDFVRLAGAGRGGIAAARLETAVDDPRALVRFVRERIGL